MLSNAHFVSSTSVHQEPEKIVAKAPEEELRIPEMEKWSRGVSYESGSNLGERKEAQDEKMGQLLSFGA